VACVVRGAFARLARLDWLRLEFPIWERNRTQHLTTGVPWAKVLHSPANGAPVDLASIRIQLEVKLKVTVGTFCDALTQSEPGTNHSFFLALQLEDRLHRRH
jgi:hypothetical protein